MAKGKLIISYGDIQKSQIASKLTDVVIEDAEQIADKAVLQVNYKTIQQVYEFGQTIAKITDVQKAKAAEQK